MKPITDEIIHSLIEGAERRQLGPKATNEAVPLSKSSELARRSLRMISLERAHPALRLRETVNGVFCYARS